MPKNEIKTTQIHYLVKNEPTSSLNYTISEKEP